MNDQQDKTLDIQLSQEEKSKFEAIATSISKTPEQLALELVTDFMNIVTRPKVENFEQLPDHLLPEVPEVKID